MQVNPCTAVGFLDVLKVRSALSLKHGISPWTSEALHLLVAVKISTYAWILITIFNCQISIGQQPALSLLVCLQRAYLQASSMTISIINIHHPSTQKAVCSFPANSCYSHKLPSLLADTTIVIRLVP